MNLKNLFSSLTLSVVMISTVTAQIPSTQDSAKSDQKKTDQEKAQESIEKKALILLDDILKEAATLRLAENRIRIQATAADLLWQHNEKRARAVFKQAIDSYVELLASDADAASSPAVMIIDGSSQMRMADRSPWLLQARAQLRQEILQLLTNHDPKLARDFLRSTAHPGYREEAGYNSASGEAEMDLSLAARVASSDPKEALRIAEEHLEKGLPYGIANVLFQLQGKDKEAAAKLAGGIMKRLRSENIAANQEAAAFALLLLGQEGEAEEADSNKPQSVLDENTIRELIDLLVTAALNQSAKKPADTDDEDEAEQSPLLTSLEALMPKVEKYAPSRASLLRKKIAEYERTLSPDARAYKEYETLIQKGDSRALMDAAAKADPEMKKALTSQAVIKAFGEGEFDRARQLINEQMTDAGQRKQMLASLDRQMLQHASMLGKLDEVRPLLSKLSSEERATLLAQFAVTAMGKGDKKLALQLFDEARSIIGAQATNYVELGALLQIARSYASIEPARSFDIIEPTIDQLNMLLSAVASLDGFEYWQHFKDGELIGTGPSVVVNTTLQCARDLALLSRADFDRAKAAADRFSRSDVRITAHLFVAHGVLSNQAPIVDLPISGRRVFHTPF